MASENNIPDFHLVSEIGFQLGRCLAYPSRIAQEFRLSGIKFPRGKWNFGHPFKGRQHKDPLVQFRAQLRKAILKEAVRREIEFDKKVIDELVEKVFEILLKVFRGELAVDTLFNPPEAPKPKSGLSDYSPKKKRKEDIMSRSRESILRQILLENIELRQQSAK